MLGATVLSAAATVQTARVQTTASADCPTHTHSATACHNCSHANTDVAQSLLCTHPFLKRAVSVGFGGQGGPEHQQAQKRADDQQAPQNESHFEPHVSSSCYAALASS